MKINRASRFSRAISTAQVAGIIVIIVVGAGVAYYYVTTGAPVTPTKTTAYKDTIVFGTTDSVQTTVDPADAYDYFGAQMIQNLGDALVDYAPGTTQFVPALATSWSTSLDGLTWTFNLRQSVKFPDGTPLNATVVKYSVDREFKIDESSGPFAGVGYDTIINKTVVSGPYTVQFVLNSPFAAFLALAAFTPMFPINPHVAHIPSPAHTGGESGVVNYTGNVATENPNGLGPYSLQNWVRTAGKDVEIDLTANPSYWNASAGYAKTKNIIIKFYTDSTSLNLALQNGAVDMAYHQLAAADLQSYASNSNFKVWNGPGQFIQYLTFDEKIKPFDSLAVRQAIASALDRSLITTTVFLGQRTPLYSMIPIGMSYHTDIFKSKYGDANITGAVKLLQAAGYSASNPLKFTLTYPTGHYQSTDGIGSALKQALEKTGVIQVTLANQPWANYKQSTKQDQLQVYIYGWFPDFVDPYDYTQPFLPSDGQGFLHTNYVNPQMSQLLSSAAKSSDSTQLTNIYSQIQGILARDAPIVPLFQGTEVAVSNTKLSGLILDATTILRLWFVQETS